ncbi:hypothetical protein BJ875DRAFT_461016 [Amylocarpus encephaloides]|uniref:Uncharacterized protein n=1 Tax=Amylocarpus encephaloides TaxID=45428 RepID=A0A9P7YJD7_9HELO|nr:hypothetical protein BJ875DRAFT_461016 [Amylocarpus encephaloides]
MIVATFNGVLSAYLYIVFWTSHDTYFVSRRNSFLDEYQLSFIYVTFAIISAKHISLELSWNFLAKSMIFDIFDPLLS